MRFDPEALAIALDAQRLERGISWRQVGRETGVVPSSLTKLAYGQPIGLGSIVALLAWLDETDLKPYLVDP